jgi:hypothetical protein
LVGSVERFVGSSAGSGRGCARLLDETLKS